MPGSVSLWSNHLLMVNHCYNVTSQSSVRSKSNHFSWRALNRTGFGELYQLELGRRPWAPLVVPLWATMEPRYVYVTRSWSTLAEHQRGYRQLLLFISFFCWIAYFLFLPANAFMFHYMLTLVADSPSWKILRWQACLQVVGVVGCCSYVARLSWRGSAKLQRRSFSFATRCLANPCRTPACKAGSRRVQLDVGVAWLLVLKVVRCRIGGGCLGCWSRGLTRWQHLTMIGC